MADQDYGVVRKPPPGAHLRTYTPAMTTTSRAGIRLGVLTVLLTGGLALSGCGGSHAATTAKTATSNASTSASASPSRSASPTGSATPSSKDAQVVAVEKYGISFEIPKGWITLNAKKVLDGKNPGLKDLADRMGTDVDQLVRTLSSGMEVYAVSDEGARGGYLDNVNVIGQRGTDLNDDQIRLQFAAIGAKPGGFEHVTSGVGDVVRVPFTLPVAGQRAHGVSLIVFTDDSTVNITAGSHSAADADRIADQIQDSLATIAGSGPDL